MHQHINEQMPKALILLVVLSFLSWRDDRSWKMTRCRHFNLYYMAADKNEIKDYQALTRKGSRSTEHFFNSSFDKKFDVYVHPNRHSLDSTWKKDWNAPEFISECWMVASGVAKRLDLLSPRRWGAEACDHNPADRTERQKIITHELVHVFHAQHNPSPDFGEVTGIDWFVEGLATYASGQLDSARNKLVKDAIELNKVPASLDKFWTGNLKYSLSGSMVEFIDKKYGRPMLLRLMESSGLQQIMASLQTTEKALLQDWEQYERHRWSL